MDTDQKKYPTRFYGRTFLPWAGLLFLGPCSVAWCIMGPLFFLGIGIAPDEADSIGLGIGCTIAGLLSLPVVCDCCFQVFARQSPVLQMYLEGIKIRVLWFPIQSRSLLTNSLLLFPILPLLLYVFVTFVRFLTFRLFRTQTYHLQWGHIIEMPVVADTFAITGWKSKEHDDFGQLDDDTPIDTITFTYEADSFGQPNAKVIKAVRRFLFNPDVRKVLPSWQDEGTVFGNDTFDFR